MKSKSYIFCFVLFGFISFQAFSQGNKREKIEALRVAFITAIGGKLVSSPETFEQMSAIFKSNGATKIQGMARESVARLWKRFGFIDKATLVETKI